MEEIYSWIKNILVYMIINTIIMNLLGNKSYKKYISIVSGMILVLIVITPVIKLMKLEDSLDYYLKANEFSIEASDFKNDLKRVEERQKDALFAAEKEKIRVQVEQLLSEESLTLKSFEVVFELDPESADFAKIKVMKLTADRIDDGGKDEAGSISIEEIEVYRIIIGTSIDNSEQSVPSPLEIRVKNKLSDFYNLEQGNINISVQGE